MATKTTPPAPPVTPPAPPAEARFFTWMRGLGLAREPGWIGGVCAGIAARLGIDPLIVRGIVVVVAVLGGPAFLLYAAAWLLLPDARDKIHLEELIRGRIESPLAAIGALVLLSLLPVAQGIWYTGAQFWGEPSWGEAAGRVGWTVVVLAAIVAFVVWVARRASSTEPTVMPATTDDRPETIPNPVVANTVTEPVAPPAGAPAEDVAEWRVRLDAWKAEREEFRAQSTATSSQRAKEARERALAANAERAERRRVWRAENPRAGAAYSAIALGTAALAGGVVALASPLGERPVTVGFAVAAIALGVAIALAGILRRRTDFLRFVSFVLLVVALLTAALPTDRTLLLSNTYITNSGSYLSPVSDIEPEGRGIIDVWQGSGSVTVYVDPGVTARIEITSVRGEVWVAGDDPNAGLSPLGGQVYRDDAWHSTTVVGSGTPTVTVRLWQATGSIVIQDNTKTETTP